MTKAFRMENNISHMKKKSDKTSFLFMELSNKWDKRKKIALISLAIALIISSIIMSFYFKDADYIAKSRYLEGYAVILTLILGLIIAYLIMHFFVKDKISQKRKNN